MKISTRFAAAAIVCATTASLIGALLTASTVRVAEELKQNRAAAEIQTAVAGLRYLTLEYALQPEARVQQQWQARSASLGDMLIASNGFDADEERASLLKLRESHNEIALTFVQLIEVQRARRMEDGQREVLDELVRRLASSVVNRATAMIGEAIQLQEISREEVTRTQRDAIYRVIALSVGLALVVTAMMFFTFRSIMRPLVRLREGTALIAAGSLDHVIGLTTEDEIGDLSRAFDQMTRKLRETTVSRDELAAEVAERQRAQDLNKQLAGIVESSGDAIISKTIDGVMSSWNRGAERIFGYAAEEAIGRPALILFPAERGEEEAEILARIRRDEAISNFETVRMRKDGKLVDVSVTVSPLKDDSGKIVGVSTIARDITEHRRKEEELRQSESRFRSLVTATSQIVWNASADGKVRGPLPSWQAYTGQTEAEIQDIGWTRALHPDDVPHSMAVWLKAVETGSLYEVDYRMRRHDGAYRLFAVRGAAVLNDDGRVREWVGTCTDITEKRQAEIERDRFFSLSLDLMCIASADGYFRRLNPAFERTLGYTTEEMLKQPFMHFIHPDDVAATQAVVATLAAGIELVNFENRYRCKDGTYRWCLWTCVPADGQLYATARDITGRKRAEQEIQTLNTELEQRVRDRTAQLEAANQELEAFSYSVSHDLRAPLRGIDSFSRMVIEDHGPKLDADGQRQLNVIRSEAQRMGQLIDELLNFSRLGRQEVRSAHFEMNALVQSVFDELPASARERVRQFKIHPLPNAYGDRAMIRQVLVNLISNAVKFSSQVADPEIEISGETVDGWTTYRVKDNGVGFDPRYAHKLFGVFQRLHAEHEFEGTGVGLAIVQRVIHRHGGVVAAVGVPDHGATFSFTMPAENKPGKEN